MFIRRLTVAGMLFLFVVMLAGITGCGLFEAASGADFTNALGAGGNGPGSGNWVPPQPSNQDQCRQLHDVGSQLQGNLTARVTEMDSIRARCVDELGKFLPGVDIDRCTQEFANQAGDARNLLADLRSGGEVYAFSCIDLGGGGSLPPWPMGVDDADLGECEQEERTDECPDDGYVPPWNGCLTCTQRLDTGYAYYQPLRLVDFAGY